MARPRKVAAEQKSEQVSVRLTAAERALLEEQAHANGVTVGQLIRRRALKLPVVPATVRGSDKSRVDASLITELNRIGNNINQLAHDANRGLTERPYWQKLGDELRKVLERLVVKR